MKKYAQINLETGMIEAISWVSGEVTAHNLISVDEDFDLTNKKYINGEWVEYESDPEPDPEPTQLDRIESMIAKDNETIAQEAVDAYTLELIEEGVL